MGLNCPHSLYSELRSLPSEHFRPPTVPAPLPQALAVHQNPQCLDLALHQK
jgi:hypothetical protein